MIDKKILIQDTMLVTLFDEFFSFFNVLRCLIILGLTWIKHPSPSFLIKHICFGKIIGLSVVQHCLFSNIIAACFNYLDSNQFFEPINDFGIFKYSSFDK